jgi:hypothetical protein
LDFLRFLLSLRRRFFLSRSLSLLLSELSLRLRLRRRRRFSV